MFVGGAVGIQYVHIPDKEQCDWIRERVEDGRGEARGEVMSVIVGKMERENGSGKEGICQRTRYTFQSFIERELHRDMEYSK